ncbi:putative membrane protein YeaQ/YmgE (transglycosylase-associated protein family) [Breznakia sp. PF5-3]|uniref:GlsB/YeaQ/YmgE family stress response membrane protein n=1 Tax=unclassified Breznakia TaxID=2623764 RepID=UPI0024057B03|nr:MULTISPECIES: GlsB/YeaQ/YmgE family stress response membrane protein [unclassified Breznakia]MDF9824049.1 putative membrane protein YeaQ/YmgE (transglycosylase-associated protein family) [Breznakia sp. PM6-1]MDF9834885.1 putative membrane protein YeaQ/YmgE (transglycosylase-associated protein family) [Breznakia sp. PF5-3]MDF9837093.1 putative membrane protein YeaQ/YmgE (transglycosylase-associated protein family) [Breznakia sp. PFB2-8]MDF9859018.1 putative membrane protein YeaQ/YmgE (transgl
MLSFIWSLIIGGIIGAIAGFILGKGTPAGIIGNIIFGFIGSWVGTSLFGNWGPVIGGFAFVPALIGAILTIAVYSFFFRRSEQH